MQYFVIGGSGYIGSAVCARLMADGHELVGLARSETSAARLAEAGVRPVRGSLADTGLLAEQAAATDGVIQISTGGFLTQALETVDQSINATRTLIDALDDGKLYLWTSGVGAWMDTGSLQPDRVVTEADPMTPAYYYAHLRDVQLSVLGESRLRGVVIAPGQVYGRDGGYIGPIARQFNGVRAHGVAYAVAPGDNACTFVHVDDLADLYALAVGDPEARGLYFGAVDTVTAMDIAHAVSRASGLGGEVVLVNHGEMRELNGRANEFDFFVNARASSAHAMTALGWNPHRPGVIEELGALPQPLDLQTVYPSPTHHASAARVKL
ncbi:NAD-dependent epimerase/dehydratase family protein [Tsukamurella pseudospumae]|uniref:NAD-dependent epimerase/dehydratase domain-containing protein n=1 Tax=Tsukamurella pseudospumae TaxID=239498 RepID=A0A138AIZ8_9ACTN|nr:NAD-dependent epimerase/dehydratase family protein [Tsukamurella pseudospumae]KXO96171.1 hypothetical protein AXK61_23370 [Tsukamurella pseudospumae]KXP10443.1 hypothetical protein AXK60_08355 [Tsukamurella pseudospumae]